MRAARFHDKFDIRVESIDPPTVAPGDGRVILDVAWCGICGSDLHEYLLGPLSLPVKPHPISGEKLPLTLGHEFCGWIRDPPPGSRFKNGDAVTLDPRIPCGSCIPCGDGAGQCCSRIGYYGGSTAGGFGEQISIKESELYPLGNIPLEYAALIEPLAVVHHAVKEAGVADWAEKTVLVVGGGPIGFALTLALRAHGASKILVSEPTVARREQIAAFTHSVINPVTQDVSAECHSVTGGRGVDVVFDCAGVPAGLASGIDSLRHYGLYVNVAVWETAMNLPAWNFIVKHITIKGAYIFTKEDLEEVMQMMNNGQFSGYEKMVTDRISVEDIVEKGFEELVNNKDKHIKILVTPHPTLIKTLA